MQLEEYQRIDEESIIKAPPNSSSEQPLNMDMNSGDGGINSQVIKPFFGRQVSRRRKSINYSRQLSSTDN